jgi:ribose-phosphate pyrophosphokinase
VTSTPATSDAPLLFAPGASLAFGERLAAALGTPLAALEEREFEGGEHRARPVPEVRGRAVYVVQSTSGDATASANDRLVRALFLIAALRDAGAVRVTACLPYLAYQRKDRRTRPHDQVNSRYVAQLFEAVDVDHVMAMDAHNPAAFENAFRCSVELLEAAPLLADEVAVRMGSQPVTVVSPDFGGAKRAQRVVDLVTQRSGQGVEFAVIEKRRESGHVSGDMVIGPVAGRHAVLVDDLIGAGTTLLRAVKSCREAGAISVSAFATHGVFAPGAERLLGPDGPDRLYVTDTLLPTRLQSPAGAPDRLQVLPVAGIFAAAIRRHRAPPRSE